MLMAALRFWALLATVGGEAAWGSSSGVLAITRGSESKMSAALSGGDRGKERIKRIQCHALDRDFQIDHRCLGLLITSDHAHRGSAKALTLQRLPSRAIANATQEFVKPRCRMVGDAAQHVGKPSLPSDEPSSARARPDRPSGFLRCSEHVPSTSRTVPEPFPNAAGTSNFSRSMPVLGVRRAKAALSGGCKAHPAIRSSRKQSEQSWR